MADPLSLTASLLTVAGAAISTSKTVFRVGETVIRAQRQINDLAQGLVHFNSVLRTLSRVIAIAPDALNPDGVDDAKRVCRNCSNIVREIRRVFRKLEKDDLTIIERIKWIFKQDSLRFPKARLESAKTDLMLIIEILNLSINLKQASSWKAEVLQQQYETIKLNLAASFANDVELRSSELVEEEESTADVGTTDPQSCTSLVRIQDTRDQGHFAGLCLEQSLSVTHALDNSDLSRGKEMSQTVYRQMEEYAAELVPLLLQRWTNTNVSKDLKTAITRWDEDDEATAQAESTRDPRIPETTRHASNQSTPTTPNDTDYAEYVPYQSRPSNSMNSEKQDDEAPHPKGAPRKSFASRLLPNIQDLLLNPESNLRLLKVKSYQRKGVTGSMAISSYSTFLWPSNEPSPLHTIPKTHEVVCIHMTPWIFPHWVREASPILLFNLNLRSFLKGRIKGRFINALLDKLSWFGTETTACLQWDNQYKNGSFTPGVAAMITGFWVFMISHLSTMVTEDHEVLYTILQVYEATIYSRNFTLFEAEAQVDYEGQEVHPNKPEANRIILGVHDWHEYVKRIQQIKQGVPDGLCKDYRFNMAFQLPKYRYVQVCPYGATFQNESGATETVMRAMRAGQSH